MVRNTEENQYRFRILKLHDDNIIQNSSIYIYVFVFSNFPDSTDIIKTLKPVI